MKSKFSALNYSMYFSLPQHLKKREILVCDEGSELEQQLVAQYTCEIDFQFLMKTKTFLTAFPTQETHIKVSAWLQTLAENIDKNIESYKEWFKENSRKTDMDFARKKTEYTRLTNLQNSVGTLISTYQDSQYIIERLEIGVRFTPLKVDKLSKYLFENADKVLILSATIIDPPNFCKSLGITDYEFIDVDAGFGQSTKQRCRNTGMSFHS
jgi:Rad3-related DNA helicase